MQIPAQFSALIDRLEAVGMPVRVLRDAMRYATEIYVDSYNVWYPKSRRMGFDEAVHKLVPLIKLDGIGPYFVFSEVSAVGSIYHECAHAWMQRRRKRGDAQLVRIERASAAYYRGAPLSDGTSATAKQADRLAQESVGEYVGSVASAYWSVIETRYRLQHKPATPSEVAGGPTYSSHSYAAKNESEIRSDFQRTQSYVPGYAPARGRPDQLVSTQRTMPPALKLYCHRVVLEGKIPVAL